MSTLHPPSRLGERELPRITLFGDSLTAWSFDTTHGWGIGDVLKRRFDARAEVENKGLCFPLLRVCGQGVGLGFKKR
jgi:hypothetical protein